MSRSGTVRIGISGWTYGGWRGNFYPSGLRHSDELSYASRLVATIEINGTHYSLQHPDSFARWHDETRKALSSPSLPRDTETAAALAERHDQRLYGRAWTRTGRRRDLRHAIEIRHPSFLDPAFVALLRRHRVTLVFTDSVAWPYAEDLTADFVYLRLHGSEELYASGYSDEALDHWAARIKLWARGLEPKDARLIAPDVQTPRRKVRDAYVYFDNDAKVRAPVDARSLRAKVAHHS
jgi:uncharacterized protein YecE (DUF72 family)